MEEDGIFDLINEQDIFVFYYVYLLFIQVFLDEFIYQWNYYGLCIMSNVLFLVFWYFEIVYSGIDDSLCFICL